ncbi:MAG: hypothetical protein P9M11_04165 [Candidatus Tenebribacter burtonii]|jgi:hypothetical protein|nr:hypothetical protein [Candidatus Tenebribacter burtonii]
MAKENLVNNLIKFNYRFKENENEIVINSKSKLNVRVNFKDGKVKVTSELIGWNFLTGNIKMKFENAIRYSIILSFLVIIALLLVKDLWGNNLIIFVYVFLITWSVGFVSYYNVKFENMKTRIYNWLKD